MKRRIYMMKKRIYIITAVCSVLTAALILTAAHMPVGASAKAARYVRNLGWVIDEKPAEQASVALPVQFDAVHEEYNKLQKLAGFDLTDYLGKTVTRYTFAVKNFDGAAGVRANVLVYRGNIIGGDVMTAALDGFMLPLKKRE
jgi:hypothetical protein